MTLEINISSPGFRPLTYKMGIIPEPRPRMAIKTTCHLLGCEQGLPELTLSPHPPWQPLDYEHIQQYTFTIEATDPTINFRYKSSPSGKNKARVTINVTDVDEPPVFQQPFYHFQLRENLKKPLIGSVLAKDPDATRRSIG